MEVVKALFTAIVSKIANTPFYTAMGGQIYQGNAPQGATCPYCVFLLVSGVNDPQMSEPIDNCLVQFSLFDANSSAGPVCDNYELLKDVFDDCTLTITGYKSLFVQRENQRLIPEPEDPGYWHYMVEYRMLIQEA